MRRTKIICTIGPASNSYDMIRKMALSGMNVARLNFSHGSHDEHLKVINHIKGVRAELHKPVGIMLDTKGPEVRTGIMDDLQVSPGQRVRLVKKFERVGDIVVDPECVVDQIRPKVGVLFNDGYVMGRSCAVGDGFVEVEILNSGVIAKRKGINVPDQALCIQLIPDKDVEDITFGCREKVDIIAASFVNEPSQILKIREIAAKEGREDIMVIAKIETQTGIDNFSDILEVSDGIMVARGDLGVEIPVSRVPAFQKKIIRECNLRGRVVITATHMLESMIEHPMPTRAEASDVANAVYDATSCVMLSGETAAGKYPLESLDTMNNIVCESEKFFDYRSYFKHHGSVNFRDVQSAVALAAVDTCYSIDGKVIVVCSKSGYAARRISRYRPYAMILLVTPSEETYLQSSIMWGIDAIMEENSDINKEFDRISCYCLKRGFAKYGDLLVITSGKPGVSSTTNSLVIESIGNVLVRGCGLQVYHGDTVYGEITLFLSFDPTRNYDLSGKIVIVTQVRDEYMESLRKATGIILQNNHLDKDSEASLMRLYEESGVPFITKSDGAHHILQEGQRVIMYPEIGIVFGDSGLTEKEMFDKDMVF